MSQYGVGLLLVVLTAAAIGFWATRGVLSDFLTMVFGIAAGALGIVSAVSWGRFSARGKRIFGFVALAVVVAAFGRSISVFDGRLHGGFAAMACFVATSAVAHLVIRVASRRASSREKT